MWCLTFEYWLLVVMCDKVLSESEGCVVTVVGGFKVIVLACLKLFVLWYSVSVMVLATYVSDLSSCVSSLVPTRNLGC